MHNSIKRAVSIAIAAIVLFSLPCGSIFARTHIDIDKKCSITVDIPDTWEDLYTVDFPVELYRVADVDENDVYTASLSSYFLSRISFSSPAFSNISPSSTPVASLQSSSLCL